MTTPGRRSQRDATNGAKRPAPGDRAQGAGRVGRTRGETAQLGDDLDGHRDPDVGVERDLDLGGTELP